MPAEPFVATALTVYGIETITNIFHSNILITVATALTVYGIETLLGIPSTSSCSLPVATALTVYGIETNYI